MMSFKYHDRPTGHIKLLQVFAVALVVPPEETLGLQDILIVAVSRYPFRPPPTSKSSLSNPSLSDPPSHGLLLDYEANL